MNLKEQLNSDLRQALKSRNQSVVDVLRLLNASIHNKEIEKRAKADNQELTDEEIIQVLNTEAKKRREASEIFQKGSRNDLAEKEGKELVIINVYLPKQLTSQETESIISEIIKRLNIKDFGQAMKAVMQELKGKADAKLVAEIVKKKLTG